MGAGRTYGARPAEPEPRREPGERYIERDEHSHGGEVTMHPGARVEHKTFGMGTVMGVDPGDDPVVTVKFSGYGPKRIKARFLQLAGR
jgi:DNA helicase-2/ATP-dependent DNA helicase PcrA